MSTQIFPSKGSTPLDLVKNLKISIALNVFQPSLNLEIEESQPTTTPTGLLFLNKKTDFQLFEPNSIVKYLSATSKNGSNDVFTSNKGIDLIEEKDLSNLSDINLSKIEDLKISSYFKDLNASDISQILIFSTLYPFISSLKDTETIPTWFKDFSNLKEISNGIKLALSVTKIERIKEENTNKINVKSNCSVIKPTSKIVPKENERNILITSALPYVNNVPHLGNIVGSVLSADIYARFCKNRNYNTLFVCGTDEYGTATETKALEEHVTPKELCDKYNKIHSEVYKWFDIGFDYFGRTTTEKQTAIAQDIFLKLNSNDYLESQVMKQLYCPVHNGFLADRYVEGECPKCQYEDARGDQCDKCGALLNPFELVKPRCKLDGSSPIPKESKHVFLSLNKLEPELKEWVLEASTKGNWSKNSKTITNSWLKEGLNPRCITRDLVWGTPVPLEEFKDKVLYVWFDATIGYVSITANYSDDWQKWWKNPEHVQLYQFMGKDNVPFHTVVFPATQIGTRENWTMLHHLNTTEYLQYEGGKFSKSRGVGVFGNNARDTGVSPDVWRYYLASIRPETQDSQFSWAEFVAKNNSELLANVGNLVNRLVKFVNAKYNGVVPSYDVSKCPNFKTTQEDLNKLLETYLEDMESVHLRRGLETAMFISSRGNLFLQDNKLDNSLYNDSPEKSDAVIAIGLNIIYLVASIFAPYMPGTAKQIYEILNVPDLRIPDKFDLWIQPGHCIGKAQYLFKRIDEKKIDEWRVAYGGQQKK